MQIRFLIGLTFALLAPAILVWVGLPWYIVVVVVLGLAAYTAHAWQAAFSDLETAALKFSKGDLDHRVYLPDGAVGNKLAQALNEMAHGLDEKIREISNQRGEQDALLSSMAEGIIAVDLDEKIIRINHAAASLLGTTPNQATGRSIQEVVNNVELQKLTGLVLARQEPVETEVHWYADRERYLMASARLLRDIQGQGIGVLVVLNDMTRLRQLENVRRDFVANVSHELRTPITAIKGFVETLRDGAIDNPKDGRRFLEIIARQSDRLHDIFEDLLTLSRLEEDKGGGDIEVSRQSLKEVVASSRQALEFKAAERKIVVEQYDLSDITVEINVVLLEQAIGNLIENAIKYSEPGKRVRIETGMEGGEAFIRVIDRGHGIERIHLPRLFERFYRVDKARDRKQGGTGLGLAIVKHIAQAHGGYVTVDSEVGQGSTFCIRLPLIRNAVRV